MHRLVANTCCWRQEAATEVPVQKGALDPYPSTLSPEPQTLKPKLQRAGGPSLGHRVGYQDHQVLYDE